MDVVPEVFNASIQFQASSKDLVIYSVSAGRVVTIAWPVHSGITRIQPGGIRPWLLSRDLHWPCFCAMLLPPGESCSSKIVESKTTGLFHAYCGGTQGKNCGFYVNLNEKHDSATLVSEYRELRTAASGKLPPMDTILQAFLLPGMPDTEVGEYFQGFCGEHRSQYPGTQQSCLDSDARAPRRTPINVITLAEATAVMAQGPYYAPPHLMRKPMVVLRPRLASSYVKRRDPPASDAPSAAATRPRKRQSLPIPKAARVYSPAAPKASTSSTLSASTTSTSATAPARSSPSLFKLDASGAPASYVNTEAGAQGIFQRMQRDWGSPNGFGVA
ncbi:hypothetical protein FPV67DRAFT_1782659 [Lyophyllum atratum]|nr:hypothetical protein FPV67DRAFT_1782659 [Lyophyllum atratum]